MKTVAITGIMSSGKSSVCRMLRELGARVVSADQLVHELMDHDPEIIERLKELFGNDVIQSGKVDREAIAKQVFHDTEKLVALERLMHPAVRTRMESELKQARQEVPTPPLFVAEIPLLFEVGLEHDYDLAVTVTADESQCRERFTRAMGGNGEEFRRRMARQLSQTEKAALADQTIANTGDLEDLRRAVEKFYQSITQ